MAILKDKKITERYGIYESQKTIFSKFRTRKEEDGEIKYRGRETKHYKITRDIYNFKGQMIFKFKVSSYKKQSKSKSIIRDFVTLEEVIVEKSQLQTNLKDVIENAKLQAVYSHYAKKGERWKITNANYGKIKDEIVKIELLDYIVAYNKGYNKKLGMSRVKFERDDRKNMNISLYNDKDKKFQLYSSTAYENVKDSKNDIEKVKIDAEKNFTKLY